MKLMLHTMVLFAVTMYIFSCTPSHPVANGGGSEVEVVGYIYNPGNQPAAATQVKLIPVDYDPATMPAIADAMIDTTDENGRYTFTMVTPGIYNVQAVQLAERTRLLVTGVDVNGDTTVVPADSLSIPGAIRLFATSGSLDVISAAIPGTDISVSVSDTMREVLLDSIPAALIPEIRYMGSGNESKLTLKNIRVLSSATVLLANPTWQYHRDIVLNTSASGADVPSAVYGFPVLVRLNSSNFDFSQARSDGTDLLFARGTIPLPHEIESWDSTGKNAAVWVAVDTILGNDSAQSITMYWGRTSASVESNSGSVFDTAAGFAGVWHLGDAADEPARDATVNSFDGTSPDSARPAVSTGIIGNCRKFNGTTDYITMPNTSSSILNFPENGYFTVSAWVYVDTFDHVYRTIVTKGFEQYFLQLSYFPGDSALWQFSVFTEEENWNMSHIRATKQKWMLLTGVRNDTSQSLYVNGTLVANPTVLFDQDTTRNTSNDLSIGRFMQEATFPAKFGFCYFKGDIDEVRISSVARDKNWIRLDYMNQRSDDKLLIFKQ